MSSSAAAAAAAPAAPAAAEAAVADLPARVLQIQALAQCVLSYLGPISLRAAALVNAREFLAAARDDSIWEARCNRLWRDKLACPPQLSGALHGATRLTDGGFKTLKAKALRLYAAERHVPANEIARCLEKAELRQLIAARTGSDDAGLGRDRPLRAMDRPWFAAYHHSRADACRSNMLEGELTGQTFGFFFKAVHDASGHVRPGTYRECYHAQARFLPDGTFQTDNADLQVRHPQGLTWRAGKDESGAWWVQVSQYPVHRASRTRNWGWRIENDHVVFLSDVSRGADVVKHGYLEGDCCHVERAGR